VPTIRSTLLALAALAFLGGSSASAQTEVTQPFLSERACPVDILTASTQNMQAAKAVVRKPPGKGPFPAVVFLHGGLNERNINRDRLVNDPGLCRSEPVGRTEEMASRPSRPWRLPTRRGGRRRSCSAAAFESPAEATARSVADGFWEARSRWHVGAIARLPNRLDRGAGVSCPRSRAIP